MIKGKIIVFNGSDKQLEVRTEELTSIKSGEILVKNLFTTICGSDIHTFSGLRNEPCPVVLGHEIVGEIVEINDDHSGYDHSNKKLRTGDIVTWSIFSSDPKSTYSMEGIPQKGDKLFKYGHAVLDANDPFNGGLAEYCVLKPDTSILKVPFEIPLPIAATINCAISTIAGAIRLAGNIKDKNIFIYGMGMLGIACAAMCKDAGANWVGSADISSKRLDNALKFGVDDIYDFKEEIPLTEIISKKFLKKGVDIVFDMSGSPAAMEDSIDLLAIGGTAIWVGAVFNTRRLQIDPEKIIRNLITIKGLHNYNFEDFSYAVDFIKRNWKKYPFEEVVEKEFDLIDAQKAFEYALTYKPLRVGLRINSKT